MKSIVTFVMLLFATSSLPSAFAGNCMCCSQTPITIQVKVGEITTTANVSADVYAKLKAAILNNQNWDHIQLQDLAPILNCRQFGPPILMVAVQKGDLNSVKSLLNYGANPHRKYQGKDSIDLAREMNNAELIQILTENDVETFEETDKQ